MKHYDNVSINANAYEAMRNSAENVKVTIGTFYHNDVIGSFFIPVSTYKLGYQAFYSAIKARAKRDLGITFGHNSSCGY